MKFHPFWYTNITTFNKCGSGFNQIIYLFLQELTLKLQFLSHSRSQTTSDSEDSEESEHSEKEKSKDDAQKWSDIGQELRMIADCFGTPDDFDDTTNAMNPFGVNDLLGLINLMLPVTVPQSLWSALLSYAAWKIFKRFQWFSVIFFGWKSHQFVPPCDTHFL